MTRKQKRFALSGGVVLTAALAGALIFYQFVWAAPPAYFRVQVLGERPHDRTAYTQGYQIADGILYESTGQLGESQLRATDPWSGEVLRSVALPADQFGEGLAVLGDKIIQITWQNGIAHVWDRNTFESVGTFSYEGQGWGLCTNGVELFMTDGSATMQVRDPNTFELKRTINIRLIGKPLDMVNELEWVDGFIWGNVYRTDAIVKIDPNSGAVIAAVDCSGILSPEDSGGVDVLNGIAYDSDTQTFLITGKHWPKAFEAKLESIPRQPTGQ